MVAEFTIDRALRKGLRQLAAEVDATEPGQEPEVLQLKLGTGRALRFIRIAHHCSAYKCTKLDIVLKQPSYIKNNRTPKRIRVPTIKLNDTDWVAQPVVDLKRNIAARTEILRQLPDDFHGDLHGGNVGWWKGKAVAFDW